MYRYIIDIIHYLSVGNDIGSFAKVLHVKGLFVDGILVPDQGEGGQAAAVVVGGDQEPLLDREAQVGGASAERGADLK